MEMEGDVSSYNPHYSSSLLSIKAPSNALYELVSQMAGPVLDIYVDQTQRYDAENNLRFICSTSFRDKPQVVHQKILCHTGAGRSASVPLKKSTPNLEDRYRRLKNQYIRLRNLLLEVLAREQAVTTLSKEADALVNYICMACL